MRAAKPRPTTSRRSLRRRSSARSSTTSRRTRSATTRTPDAGRAAAKSSFIFGFNFDYRVRGRSDDRVQCLDRGRDDARRADGGRQLCSREDPAEKPPVCERADAWRTSPTRPSSSSRTPRSLEVWASPRVEFHTLQGGHRFAGETVRGAEPRLHRARRRAQRVYALASRRHSDLRPMTARSTDSYLEVGWGKNELFSTDWNRLKISGLLSFSLERLPLWRDLGRIFVEMTHRQLPRRRSGQHPDVLRRRHRSEEGVSQ